MEGNDPYLAMTFLISVEESRYIQVGHLPKTLHPYLDEMFILQRVFSKTVSEGYFTDEEQVAERVWEFFHDTRPCQGILLMPHELGKKPG